RFSWRRETIKYYGSTLWRIAGPFYMPGIGGASAGRLCGPTVRADDSGRWSRRAAELDVPASKREARTLPRMQLGSAAGDASGAVATLGRVDALRQNPY